MKEMENEQRVQELLMSGNCEMLWGFNEFTTWIQSNPFTTFSILMANIGIISIHFLLNIQMCVCVWLCFFCVLSWSNSFEFLFPIVQTWMFSFCLIYMRKWWCDNHWPACCHYHYTLLQTSDSTFSKEFFFSIGASTERFEQASIASQFNGCKQISSV